MHNLERIDRKHHGYSEGFNILGIEVCQHFRIKMLLFMTCELFYIDNKPMNCVVFIQCLK